eukprot:TRINITY_DN3105_c0_g1_i2.p1 TRINITY_DN3105_c0_g1~~TRINITY_DN3105_c0_g1_i2.p1  ORF type:complete len:656 (+),score=100.87 TRINITY_DN3105_c0_g1_i2:255-2222(+)
MNEEKKRLKTFEKLNWPLSAPPPSKLAASGFYFNPKYDQSDACECFSCGVRLYCWNPNDDVNSEHQKHSPKCRHMRGKPEKASWRNNVPLSETEKRKNQLREAPNSIASTITNTISNNVITSFFSSMLNSNNASASANEASNSLHSSRSSTSTSPSPSLSASSSASSLEESTLPADAPPTFPFDYFKVLNQWKSIKENETGEEENKGKKDDLLKSLLEQTEGVLLFLTNHYQKEVAPHAEALLSTLISLLEIRVSLKKKALKTVTSFAVKPLLSLVKNSEASSIAKKAISYLHLLVSCDVDVRIQLAQEPNALDNLLALLLSPDPTIRARAGGIFTKSFPVPHNLPEQFYPSYMKETPVQRTPLSTETTQHNYISTLPTELLLKIFSFLPKSSLMTCRRVCKEWKLHSCDPSLWETLNLYHVHHNADDIVIWQLFSTSGKSLKKLSLAKCSKVTITGLKFVTSIAKDLQVLDVTGIKDLTDEWLEEVSTNCPCLHSLYLFSCNKITDRGVKLICRNVHHRLQALDIGRCIKLTDQSLECLSICCPNIVALGLAECCITDLGISSLTLGCTKIETIYLFGCDQITSKSITLLLNACSNLRNLFIGGCNDIWSDDTISYEYYPNTQFILPNGCARKGALRNIFSQTNLIGSGKVGMY